MIKMCRSDLEDVGHAHLLNQMLERGGLPANVDTRIDSDEEANISDPPSPSDRHDQYVTYFGVFQAGPSQVGPSQTSPSQTRPSLIEQTGPSQRPRRTRHAVSRYTPR